MPTLVSTTSATSLTPGGTLTLNYTGFIPYIVAAIKELAATIAEFADHLTTRDLTFTRATGDDLTVKHLHADDATTGTLCVRKSDGTDACITGDQLAALVSQSAAAGLANPTPTPTDNQFANPTPAATSPTDPASPTPPVISINGANPAHVHVGDTYNDLGATITGPQADLNLGIKTFLNGALVSDIVLDTSTTTTDTIDYVATDTNGLTSTSTRTVIVEATPAETATSAPQ